MKKILVADDSVTIQKVIALTFADEPVEIQSVGSGSDALEKMKDWRPDIILADVIMPQVNGYELCRAVKENESTRDIPVLLLAGTFEAFDEEEAKGAGADDFITKPFESVELINKVNLLLEKSAPAAYPDAQAVPEAQAPPAAVPEAPAAEPGFESIREVPAVETSPAPAPPGGETTREPDIWDILSEADEMKPVKEPGEAEAETETASPSIGPLEGAGAGVVDFGSFDVGLDRAGETAPTAGMHQDAGAGSKIEQREKDFFGLETEASEPELLDVMGEAVEEITFEVPEPEPLDVAEPAPADMPEPVKFDVQEVSPFEVQEPAPPVVPEASAFDAGKPVPPDMEGPAITDLREPAAFDVPEPVPSEVKESPTFEVSEPEPLDVAEPAPADMPEPVKFGVQEASPFETREPAPPAVPEPSLSDVSEEKTGFAVPEPIPEEASETVEAALSRIDDVRLEAIVREVVEKKVEEIAWEVVPELSEVLIREAIEKIKSGGA